MASKGKRVRSDTKFIVCNVYDYFERESQKNMKVHQGGVKLKKKTVDATGLSKRTVDAILAEKRSLGGGEFESPRKCYKKSRVRVDPDDFDISAIPKTVHQFYDQKTHPTLCKLHSTLKERGLFGAGRTTLWKLLHKIGFSYRKVNDKRYVYEQHRIINWPISIYAG